jgi:hypothetical protein
MAKFLITGILVGLLIGLPLGAILERWRRNG